MRKTIILLSLLFFVAAPALRAQWSGRVDFSTGLGGMMGNREYQIGNLGHLLTQGDFTLRYRTDKFTWTNTLNGSWEPKSSDNSRMNLKLAQQDEIGLDLVYKTVKTRPLQVGIRSDFGWKPSATSSYSAWISYRYKNDRARNVSNSLTGTIDISAMDPQQRRQYYESPRDLVEELSLDDLDSYQASCYYETPRMDEHSMTTGASGDWQLGPKSLLQASLSLATAFSGKHTTWSVFKTSQAYPGEIDVTAAFHEGNAWMYRITPTTADLDFSADIHLRQTERDDSQRFRWTPGVRVFGNHSLDKNSGASLSDITPDGSYVWQDSLRLRETFDFFAMTAAPFAAVEYRGRKIEVQADYSLQFYFYRLNDDTHLQPLALSSVKPSGNARFTWKISDVHRLGLTHDVGVDYPDYLKICWYDRTGGYADQLYRGNKDLVSTLHSRYGITYELQYKRFRYRTSNTITRKINEIDQTWSNEEIEGRLYKVFHWINSSDSWSFGTFHRFGWEGKVLKAGVGVEYNQSRRTAKANGAVRDASDWRLTMDADLNLGKGWTFGANARYRSKVATFFTRFDEYWELGARLQKKFERFTIYLDGRDLLDEALATTYESADGRELWVDVARENRRLFLLGLQWNF